MSRRYNPYLAHLENGDHCYDSVAEAKYFRDNPQAPPVDGSTPIDAPELTTEQRETIEKIRAMSHFEMCQLWRFAPSGHPYFDSSQPFAEVFKERLFTHFGGFTPAISKALG